MNYKHVMINFFETDFVVKAKEKKCHDFSSFRIQTYLGTEELQIFAIYMYMYFMNSPK